MVVVMAKIYGHTREGGLCGEWPLREGPLYIHIGQPIFRVCPGFPLTGITFVCVASIDLYM